MQLATVGTVSAHPRFMLSACCRQRQHNTVDKGKPAVKLLMAQESSTVTWKVKASFVVGEQYPQVRRP